MSPPKKIAPNTQTHPFNGPYSGTTHVSRYQKGKTNLDFTEARDSEWQWHQLGYMQVCTLLQTDNHTSTPPLCILQAGCPSCRPTNSVKALEAKKLPLTRGDLSPHLMHGFWAYPSSLCTSQTTSRLVQPFKHSWWLWPTCRPWNVGNIRPHICTVCIWYGLYWLSYL